MPGNESAIPAFIRQAILDCFKVQASLDVTVSSVATVKTAEAGGQVDCVSVLGIRSSEHTGSLSLWFPKPTFLAILERMLGEPFTDITPDNVDACGEFLNIIYASARLNINQAGFDFQPAIPTTVAGKDLSVVSGAHALVLKISCESELGPFAIGFSLQRIAKPLSQAS